MHRVLLDDLHTLSRYLNSPVLFLCIWIEFAECIKALLLGLQELTHQIFFESDVAFPNGQKGEEVLRIDGAEEIEIGAMLEKLCRETCVRSKKHRNLAFDVAPIEVRHRHGW